MTYLVERTTNLESFYNCPKKFMEVEWKADDDMTARMFLGDIGHLAHQNIGLADDIATYYFKNILPKLSGKNNLLQEQFQDILKLIAEFIDEYQDREKAFEVKLGTIIEDAVFVTGTADMVVYKEIEPGKREYKIFDFKIASGTGYYEMTEYRLQPYLYGYMVCEIWNLDKIDFEYLVYVKKNKPELKRIKYEIKKDEAYEKIKSIVTDYYKAKVFKLYEPRKNAFCKSCPLYKDCPLFKEDDVKLLSDTPL